MSKQAIQIMLKASCEDQNVPYALAAALVEVNSGWNPHYCLVDLDYQKANVSLPKPPGVSIDTDFIQQRTKLGLFGVYGYLMRRAGFDAWLSSLLFPEVSIEWGLRYMRALSLKFEGDDLLSAFHFGFPRRSGKTYLNSSFIKSVRQHEEVFRGERQREGFDRL